MTRPADLRREAFPALANFLTGYLHEDYPVTHGSLANAVRAFIADAAPAQRRQLVEELETLTRRLSGRQLRVVRRFITADLRSRWEPRSHDDLRQLLDLFRGSEPR